jgi:L,D-transpeptidase YcbB
MSPRIALSSSSRLFAAAALWLGVNGFGASAACAAEGGGDPHLRLFSPPPLIAQYFAATRAAEAPLNTADFPPFVVSPVAEAHVVRAEPDLAPSAEIAFALYDETQRDLIALLDRITKTAPDLEARRRRRGLAAAYAARDYKLFWRAEAGWSLAARAVAERLRAASEDGLDLSAAPLPDIAQHSAVSARDELALSEAVVAYAHQAAGGRIDPTRISRLIGARPDLPPVAAILGAVTAAGARAGDALRDYNPPHYGYQALRAKLAELRARHGEEPPPQGRAARFARVAGGVESDETLARGRARAAAPRQEAEVIANMERWRWLPRDMGENRVEVNIPEFELAVVRGGVVAHRARVIVGKEETPTPVFSNALRFIIVNPYWNVPPSIINKEMLPKYGGDVSAIEQRGFKVAYRGGKLTVRQPPGEGNALGRIKFMFPNDFAVYLHDTPSRGLFGQSRRAFSHGCMRVEDPFALAEAVLGPDSGWSEERVRRLIGEHERYINLSRPLPIHIEYFTAYVDEYGELRLRDDIYGYSARVRRALGLGG